VPHALFDSCLVYLGCRFCFLCYPNYWSAGGHLYATVIPTVGQSGGSANIRIQVISYTTDAERGQLKEAFSKEGSDNGLVLLRTMSKGYINVIGQSGRKIMAAFSLDNPNGKRLILITEHLLSEYEKTQNIRAQDYPLAILRIQFDPVGKAKGGEVYPAVKLSFTTDGFLDAATQSANIATMIDIVRTN
jgi:hypothetical protein